MKAADTTACESLRLLPFERARAGSTWSDAATAAPPLEAVLNMRVE